MIKTVKFKKKFRLDELIKYVRENHIGGEHYKEYFSDCKVYLLRINGYKLDYLLRDKTSGLQSDRYPNIPLDTTFTFEVEEEITEDTVFQDVVIVVLNGINPLPPTKLYSIRNIRRDYPTVREIHTLINGKLELIYEKNV